MGKREIKTLVLFQFRDYYNLDYIRNICNSTLDSVIDEYDYSSNISEDIFCSLKTCNKINYTLLNSENDDDVLYMMDKSEKIFNIISNVKRRKGISNDVEFGKVFDYVQLHYDGKKSYPLYFNDVIKNELYLQPEYDLEKEQEEVLRLEKMQTYEKKLRLLN